MVDYIRKMLDDLMEGTKGESEIPSTHHLFDIADEPANLSKEYSEKFHHFVAQLLYLLNRVISYI